MPVLNDAEIGELGRGIGSNTPPRELGLVGEAYMHDSDGSNEQYKLLCKGLKENQSIKELSLNCFCRTEGEIWEYLGPFLENSKNLKHLCADGHISCKGMQLLVNPLMR